MKSHLQVGIWSSLPFVLMLAATAVSPMVIEEWWSRNRNKMLTALVLGLPSAALSLWSGLQGELADLMIFEYVPFIVLLGALFVISGGIRVTGDIRATPRNNVLFLAAGTLLASWIGTTGAAMLLIRPFLQTNRERARVAHSVVFFIFLVCNAGGLLTPLGDPPLFLGYLLGVPFTWTLSLWKIQFFVSGVLLMVYYFWDRREYARESPSALRADVRQVEPIRIQGKRNFAGLLAIVACVGIINGQTLSFIPLKAHASDPAAYYGFLREGLMVVIALVSFHFTPKRIRVANRFSFAPIEEVALVFLGIFLTMVPAMGWLNSHGSVIQSLLSKPTQYFWASGALSSVLDNAPTYVTFFTAAGICPEALGADARMAALLGAISAGSVLMGAMTYIGNGPNFMVRAVAEEHGVRMPSFFGYVGYSAIVLLPMFVAVTLVFF